MGKKIFAAFAFLLLSISAVASDSISIDTINNGTGFNVITLKSASSGVVATRRLTELNSIQVKCVQEAFQAINLAAIKVYGSVRRFESLLSGYNFAYRIKFADETSPESVKFFGGSKLYAKISLGLEINDDRSSQAIIEELVSTYIDHETNQISCAASTSEQIENFLKRDYQPYINKYYPGR